MSSCVLRMYVLSIVCLAAHVLLNDCHACARSDLGPASDFRAAYFSSFLIRLMSTVGIPAMPPAASNIAMSSR